VLVYNLIKEGKSRLKQGGVSMKKGVNIKKSVLIILLVLSMCLVIPFLPACVGKPEDNTYAISFNADGGKGNVPTVSAKKAGAR
jgi:hypothetical protein